jgi:alkylhydroperoxidase/carboxymuconolactone decarboxylase family protein YurZ
MTADTRALGIEVMRDLIGDRYTDLILHDTQHEAPGWLFADHAIEACFGTIWSRPELDMKSRSIATIAMLVALNDPSSLKSQIRAGLRNGLSEVEITEIIYQAIPYLGYPLAGAALRTAKDAFADDSMIPANRNPSSSAV